MTSGLKGKNINSLASSLRAASSPGMKIAVLGTTNVGKSSLVKQIIQLEGGHQAPTVSKFPGTTVGLSNWAILKGRNTLIDTPGLTPGHRLTDLFCVNCVSNLFTTTKLEQKLWGIKPGKSLVLGGYAALTWLGAEETVLIAFAPTAVHLHRTDQEKVDSLLTEKPQWLHQLCKTCQAKLEWEEHRIQLAEDQDIAIAGLGWISVRRQGGEFRLHIPKGIRWEIRPALVGKRVKE